MESLKTKYSDMYTLVPVEIEGQLQDVSESLQQVEAKVRRVRKKAVRVKVLMFSMRAAAALLLHVHLVHDAKHTIQPNSSCFQLRLADSDLSSVRWDRRWRGAVRSTSWVQSCLRSRLV